MSDKNDLVAMAKSMIEKSNSLDGLKNASPEVLAALESVASQLKQASGDRSAIAKLADQVNGLVEQAKKK